MNELVTIKDHGRPEYLDGARMQYTIYLGTYSNGRPVAFCETLDIARVIANALAETVIIDQS